MRYLVPICVFIAAAAVHAALSASLDSHEKEEKSPQHDVLTKLQEIDLMAFEAAQKAKAAQVNVTEEQNEDDTRYLEAAQDGSVEEHVETGDESTAEGVGSSDAAARAESESESSEETDGRQRREHHETVTETGSKLDEVSQDLPKEKDVLD